MGGAGGVSLVMDNVLGMQNMLVGSIPGIKVFEWKAIPSEVESLALKGS